MNGTRVAPLDPDFRVRPAVPEDAATLHALSTAAILRSAATHYGRDQLRAWAATRSPAGHLRLIQQTTVLVAVHGAHDVAGFAAVALDPVDSLVLGEVDQLFVSPRHGGRGVARLLMSAVETAACGSGRDELVTHASWRAVPAFEAFGFTRVEVEWVTLEDQRISRVLMRKLLRT